MTAPEQDTDSKKNMGAEFLHSITEEGSIKSKDERRNSLIKHTGGLT
jgi:hypothetical protein